MNKHLLNKIISVAYNDANIADKIYIRYMAFKNPEIKKLLDAYRSTYLKVRDIRIDECPDTVSNNVLQSIQISNGSKKSFKNDLFTMFILNPRVVLYSAVAATLVIIFSIVFNLKKNEIDYGPYTKQEVMLANNQIKESLALIGKVFHKTQNTIETEIIAKRVSRPINKSINTINNLFLEGGKNENIN